MSARLPASIAPISRPSACAPPLHASVINPRASRLALSARTRCAYAGAAAASIRACAAPPPRRSGCWNRCRRRSGRRAREKLRAVEDAVAERGLGERAQAGDRARRRKPARLVLRSCASRGSGTSAHRRPALSSSHATGVAFSAAMQSATSLVCSAAWMWIGPSPCAAAASRKRLRRHGAQRMRRDAERAHRASAFDDLARAREQRGVAVRIVEEALLPSFGAAPPKPP